MSKELYAALIMFSMTFFALIIMNWIIWIKQLSVSYSEFVMNQDSNKLRELFSPIYESLDLFP